VDQVSSTAPLLKVDVVESRLTSRGGDGDLGGAPPLPDVAGQIDDAGATWRVGWMSGSGDAALMWLAMSETARTAMRDMADAKSAKRAFQNAKVDGKKSQVACTEKQLEAERDEAERQFTDSVVTAVIVCAISYASTQVGQAGTEGATAATDSANQAKQMAVANLATPIADVWSKYKTMESKQEGPQRQADEKRLEGMRWEQQAEMMDQMVEESQGNYDESKELFKLSLRILSEHYELRNQSTQALTRG